LVYPKIQKIYQTANFLAIYFISEEQKEQKEQKGQNGQKGN
jgi:hypothetical protein